MRLPRARLKSPRRPSRKNISSFGSSVALHHEARFSRPA